MNKILLVITSSVGKTDRIYYGEDEWCDGWKFEDKLGEVNMKIAFRKRSAERIICWDELSCWNELSNLRGASRSEDSIIWIRGIEKNYSPSSTFNLAIEALLPDFDVYVAYHDTFVRDCINQANMKQLKRSGLYSLSTVGSEEEFKPIIRKDQKGKQYLYPMADFDDIFNSFFLDPSCIFAFVKHKLTGDLSSIDLDLQVLRENDFKKEDWQSVVESYQGGDGSERIRNCKWLIYDNNKSLKRLCEKERKGLSDGRKATLDERWERLNDLLPESNEQEPIGKVSPKGDKLYTAMFDVIAGLDTGDKQKVRQNFQESKQFGGGLFHQWLAELDHAIDHIKQVIMEEGSDSEGSDGIAGTRS